MTGSGDKDTGAGRFNNQGGSTEGRTMAEDQFNPVVILRTGQVWQLDMAVDALKRAGVPHMVEEERASGLRLAMPVAPAPGPGVCWTLRVPGVQLEKAKQVLSELPFEIKTNPDAWDFNPDPEVKKGWRTWIVVALVFVALAAVLSIIRLFK
jgi:hypothetical protein